MKIESLSIYGFRCFDDNGETVYLDALNCFVGPNASGKTAAMIALSRVFGETRVQRLVNTSDFHLKPGENIKDKAIRKPYH